MMAKWIIVFFSGFLLQIVSAQIAEHVSIPLTPKGDTSYSYRWTSQLAIRLNLPPLLISTDSIHFRFWANGQVVDIWMDDSKTYEGKITNYTESYEAWDMEKQASKPSKIFCSMVPIDSSIARKVAALFESVNSIPAQDSIAGWSSGCDGIIYVFEASATSWYTYKSYWTPTAQDSSLSQAKQIQAFADSISSTLNLAAAYDLFFSALEPGAYTYDQYMITLKLTEKQKRRVARYEKRQARKED